MVLGSKLISGYEFEGTFDTVIANITKLKEYYETMAAREGWQYLQIVSECGEAYDGRSTYYFDITYDRLETDEEFKKRIEGEAYAANRAREQRKLQYEQLKAEFDQPITEETPPIERKINL